MSDLSTAAQLGVVTGMAGVVIGALGTDALAEPQLLRLSVALVVTGAAAVGGSLYRDIRALRADRVDLEDAHER